MQSFGPDLILVLDHAWLFRNFPGNDHISFKWRFWNNSFAICSARNIQSAQSKSVRSGYQKLSQFIARNTGSGIPPGKATMVRKPIIDNWMLGLEFVKSFTSSRLDSSPLKSSAHQLVNFSPPQFFTASTLQRLNTSKPQHPSAWTPQLFNFSAP
jgi:hypothetical protein